MTGQTSLSLANRHLCFDNLGNLYITQDGGGGMYGQREQFLWFDQSFHRDICQYPSSCEPTGLSFWLSVYVYVYSASGFANSGSVVDAAGVNVAFNEDVVVVIARREVLGPTACDSMVLTYSTGVATCGSADGSISIAGISGGSAPYSYAWSNGSTGQVLNNVASGFYSCGYGCEWLPWLDIHLFRLSGGSSCTPFSYVIDSTIGYSGTASGSLSVTSVQRRKRSIYLYIE